MIQDINLLFSTDEFVKEFVEYYINLLINFFSGYDQIKLNIYSRDLILFYMPLELLRIIILPQGVINSVIQFVRVMTKILENFISEICWPFIDNIRVKGSKILYNNEEIEPGIKRYILEHIQSLDKILTNLERANYTVSGVKSRFCVIGLKIVGYIYDIEGRRFDIAKIIKILEWKKSENVSEAKIFIGICVYYRI